MDYFRVIAGASAYLIVLIIGLVMYAVSLRHDRKEQARKKLEKERNSRLISNSRLNG